MLLQRGESDSVSTLPLGIQVVVEDFIILKQTKRVKIYMLIIHKRGLYDTC